MKSRLPYNASLLLLLLIWIGCKKPDCLEAAGSTSRQERASPAFTSINIADNINLVLTQGSKEKIEVEGGANVIANIETSVKNEILTVRNNASCKWLQDPSQKITVYLSVANLVRIDYNGSGNISTTNIIQADGITFFTDEGAGNIDIDLRAKRTYVYIYNDNSDIRFRGSSDSCYVYSQEKGTIDFRDFKVRHQMVGYGSIRDGYVHATESLHVIMYFKGTLFYKGSPLRIKTEYLSTGKVLPMP
ncbi:MAG: DUF2807 domain-containing protein [Chitinophagaceae bacterium]